MTYEEALQLLKQRKIVSRTGRTLRLLAVGFVDLAPGVVKPTTITKEDLDATDWEADPS